MEIVKSIEIENTRYIEVIGSQVTPTKAYFSSMHVDISINISNGDVKLDFRGKPDEKGPDFFIDIPAIYMPLQVFRALTKLLSKSREFELSFNTLELAGQEALDYMDEDDFGENHQRKEVINYSIFVDEKTFRVHELILTYNNSEEEGPLEEILRNECDLYLCEDNTDDGETMYYFTKELISVFEDVLQNYDIISE